jgi:SOS-response transcriptional repressor LexA
MIIKRLNKLRKFFKKNRRLPTYEEMLHLFSLSSKNSIFKIVQKLIESGYLKKINKSLSPTSKFFAIPLLGTVPAGFPIIADEDKKYLTLDEYLISDPISSFLFTVRGDSLIGQGIFDGDLAIIERGQKAFPGDIVLAEIDREWTLKILKRDVRTRKYYLEAANPKYPNFYPVSEMTIFGVVKAVVRRIRN